MKDTTKTDALKHAMYYALVVSAVLVLRFFVSMLGGIASTMLDIPIVAALFYLLYRYGNDCRDKIYDGFWSYTNALWYYTQMAFYASFTLALVVLLYTIFAPSYLDNYNQQLLQVFETLENSGVDTTAMMEEWPDLTPQNFSMIMFLSSFISGMISGLIMAIVVKRKPNAFNLFNQITEENEDKNEE